MKILVTGGAGFIGSHLCEKLIELGYLVINIDNFNNYYDPAIKFRNVSKILYHPNYKLYIADIQNTEVLSEINEKFGGVDVIIHLAALAGVRTSIKRPEDYIDVDIKGTVKLLNFAKNINVRKFIFASSSSVYGLNHSVPFSEDDPVDSQASPYAVAKRSGELFCKTYSFLYRIPTIILRFFTVYGPRQRPDMAIYKFTKSILENKEIPVFGDGSTKRDYTYIDDVIEAIVKTIDYETDFEIFNIGSGVTITLHELIDKLQEILNRKARVKYLPEQLGDVPITWADISKAKELLGYNPKIGIEEGLKIFVEWFVNEGSNR